jgi:effector-binding domain-containing protein
MKWLSLSAAVILVIMQIAHAEEQLRTSHVGDMVIRAVPPLTAAMVSVKAEDYVPKHGWAFGDSGAQQAVAAMLTNGYDKLARWMKEGGQPTGPSFVIFNEDPAITKPKNLTCRIGYPVASKAKGWHEVKIERLPATVAAVVRYQGGQDNHAALRDSLGKWVSSRGYAPAGPFMEIYLNSTRLSPVSADDVAEIRLPVRKIASGRMLNVDSPGAK